MTEQAARRELAALARQLTGARRGLGGFSQRTMASLCGVSENSVLAWESGESMTVSHLILWARTVELRLLIADAAGEAVRCEVARESGEAWAAYELRKLAVVLRAVRKAHPALIQAEVARRAGVSWSSIKNWENLHALQTLGLIRWAMALECRLLLIPFRTGPIG